MTLSKLAQIALSTRDLSKAVTFYRDVLGLPLKFEVSGMAFFDAGGTSLMIGPAHHQGALQNIQAMCMPTIGWLRRVPSHAVQSGFGPSLVSSTWTMRADSVPLPASWISITALGLPVASSMLRQRPAGEACCACAARGSRQASKRGAGVRRMRGRGPWRGNEDGPMPGRLVSQEVAINSRESMSGACRSAPCSPIPRTCCHLPEARPSTCRSCRSQASAPCRLRRCRRPSASGPT